jgi:colicin import membrane protein
MMYSRSYQLAFIAAIFFHLSIIVLLLSDQSHQRPVLMEAKNEASQVQEQPTELQDQAIKAVSVDSKEVMETVNRLKQERLQQQQAENNRQRALAQQAEQARKQRIEEQQHIEKLKNEAAKLAIAHQKQLAEEQQRLKQLAQQKVEQEKHLAEMKQQQVQLQKQQQLEAQKLAEAKKKTDELARAEQARVAAEKAAQKQAAAQQAALNAANQARISGEVDKYKALIINAISRQWILPENADSTMSSQFRIRLAPNGAVLEVSLTRSSGDPILDRSAQAAIYKASPLPVPSDARTFNLFRDISLTVRPVNARGTT